MGEPSEFFVLLNGEQVAVPAPAITGIQLRLLVRLPAAHVLIVEGHGDRADHVLSDTDSVDLSGAIPHLYSKPPTAFGNTAHASRS